MMSTDHVPVRTALARNQLRYGLRDPLAWLAILLDPLQHSREEKVPHGAEDGSLAHRNRLVQQLEASSRGTPTETEVALVGKRTAAQQREQVRP
jgi:hypothetical protein